jgi:H+/Cl- antiporter ClcA
MMPNASMQPNLDTTKADPEFTVRFWLIAIVIGGVVGIAGGCLMRLLGAVEHSAWHYHTGDLLDAAINVSAAHRVVILCVAGVIVGLGGVILRQIFGKSGEVTAAIWSGDGHVPTLSTITQAAESIIVVGMGASLGREAPIKDAGGALASRLCQWARLPPSQRRLLVACGVGAGMAAAYNVPLGGALFAAEVLLGTMSLRWLLPLLLTSVIATASSWIFLPTGPIYRVPEFPLSVSLTVWAILAGPPLGLFAVVLVRAFKWAQDHKPTGWNAVVVPIVAFTALGAAAIPFPQLLGNGMDVVQRAFSDQLTISLLLVLPGLKLLATTGCLASGTKGGLFTPTMTIGALLGCLFAHGWNHIWPGVSIGCCAVIGAGAFLTAATQAPVSGVVLALELTRHIDATMVPMLLAVIGAMLVARWMQSQSIYSIRGSSKDAPASHGHSPGLG